jgi:tRNA (guanine37-N1)-methyltransferase
MKIDILTLFPKILEGFVSESMIGRAVRSGCVDLRVHNLRDWSKDPHKAADDRPFGGSAGMILKPEPLCDAVNDLKTQGSKVIYLCPDGQRLTTSVVRRLAVESHLILVSGHYEGVDERFREHCVHEEISIGDYILTNGTLPAAVLMDTITRYIPGVLGDEQSLEQDSFSRGLLAFPQYTRPCNFQDWQVPEVLFSGNHEKIAFWRLKQQLVRTLRRRSDLIFNR